MKKGEYQPGSKTRAGWVDFVAQQQQMDAGRVRDLRAAVSLSTSVEATLAVFAKDPSVIEQRADEAPQTLEQLWRMQNEGHMTLHDWVANDVGQRVA